jgi:hypothetical protein
MKTFFSLFVLILLPYLVGSQGVSGLLKGVRGLFHDEEDEDHVPTVRKLPEVPKGDECKKGGCKKGGGGMMMGGSKRRRDLVDSQGGIRGVLRGVRNLFYLDDLPVRKTSKGAKGGSKGDKKMPKKYKRP